MGSAWGVCKQLNYTTKYSADIYTMYELLVGYDNLNHYIPWSTISFFQAGGKNDFNWSLYLEKQMFSSEYSSMTSGVPLRFSGTVLADPL